MTAKTRYFFIGSVLVLVLGLGIGTVAYYGGLPGGLFAAGSGPTELKYIPKDAAVVAFANVRDVMGSELRQRLIKLEGSSKQSGRDEFKTETGIDIEKDIDHVVACMGAKSSPGDNASALVLARGRFDAKKLEALVTAHGGTIEEYKGKRLLTGFAGKHREGAEAEHRAEMAMSFIEPNLVAMGGIDMVRQAIDTAGSGAGVTGNPDVMKLVGEIDTNSMWAVGRFDTLTSQHKLPTEVTERIPPITWFSASGRINGGVQAMVKAEAKSKESADDLRDIIRGFTALAKMQAGNRPEAQAMWPEIVLGGEGNTVSVSFTVSSALLDAVTKGEAAKREKIEKPEPIEKKLD